MKTSDYLKSLAAWLEDPSNEAIVLAEENNSYLKVVAEALVSSAEVLKKAALDLSELEEGDLTPKQEEKELASDLPKDYEVCGECGFDHSYEPFEADKAHNSMDYELDEIASLAAALDDSDDEVLKKQASILDELLFTVAANPQDYENIKAAQAKKIDELAKKYKETKEFQDKDIKVSESEKALRKSDIYSKEYRLMEAPLSTRSCPDHPGTMLSRVGDGLWQCAMDKKIYDFNGGFEMADGSKVPGSDVSLQTKVNPEVGLSLFSDRETRLSQ